ncbi:MAG: N-formylglutamate deformylase [Beijerinckiaceae bacterium]|jgi:formiminoglutamase|nr:N-formylglutamate deformylase [Beijerinckiaceae bacterium]
MRTFTLTQGTSPLILSMPHPGTRLPDAVHEALNAKGREVGDTDWHMRQLYAFADRFNPSIIEATLSRFVIDLNRDPAGISLYPGQATTELIPTTTFDGEPIWTVLPDAAETKARINAYFEPYHAALAAEIARVKAIHGYCVLYDCHSIRSRIPRLFDGTLPVLNLGTNSGRSADPAIEAVAAHVIKASGFSHAINGRFKGGWITRHYGQPASAVHAIQMEISMAAYLAEEAPPWRFDAARAAPLQATLANLLEAVLATAAGLGRTG